MQNEMHMWSAEHREESSQKGLVEPEMIVLDSKAFVVFVHFWQVVTTSVQVGTHRVPPDWEVLLNALSQVRSVWGWLADQLMEGLAWSLPALGLDGHELSEDDGRWEPKHPSVQRALNDWSHRHEGQAPPDGEVDYGLTGEFL